MYVFASACRPSAEIRRKFSQKAGRPHRRWRRRGRRSAPTSRRAGPLAAAQGEERGTELHPSDHGDDDGTVHRSTVSTVYERCPRESVVQERV